MSRRAAPYNSNTALNPIFTQSVNDGNELDINIYGAAQNIDAVHKAVHNGWLITVTFKINLTNNSIGYILIKNGNCEYHFLTEMQIIGSGEYTIYKTPTLTNDGTALSFYNNNDHFQETIDMTFYHTPTISNNGTQIYATEYLIGGTAQTTRSNVILRTGQENILNKNTNYLIAFKNTSGATSDAAFKVQGYQKI